MGETGPCGPCSEVHYFRGDDLAENTADRVNGPGDDTVEIWNLVFMQFERDASRQDEPLPRPSVDTGAGLERIAAVLQGVSTTTTPTSFPASCRPCRDRRREGGAPYRGNLAPEDAPYRVIADHARAATMLIADGVLPSNEGRGYVLRRILRRALRYGRRLNLQEPFLYGCRRRWSTSIAESTFEPKDADAVAKRVAEILLPEETRFARTLSEGIDRVGEAASRARERGEPRLSGETVFRFYDTHGIPIEVIEEIAADEGVTIDREGFEAQLEGQRRTSRSAAKFEATDVSVYEKLDLPPGHSAFRGYPEHDFVSLDGCPDRGAREGRRAGRAARGR